MLDVSASWEAIIHRYAEPEVADRLLVNPYFRAIADRFPAAQSFAAGERMAEYVESGRYDVVVVDTPPSGGGIDFYRAPSATRDLISGKLLRLLTGSRVPGRSMLYRVTARPMLRLADAALGGPMLSDVADFLLDLRTMYDSLSTRSRTIERHLRTAKTIIATTADPTPVAETRRFFRELGGVRIAPTGIIFNRMLPAPWIEEAHLELPSRFDHGGPTGAAEANLRAWAAEARRQADAAAEMAARYKVPIFPVGWRSPPPEDIPSLVEMIDASGVMEQV
jgi:anion-transporting  ArsA/GET3 family ATPase